GSQKRSARQPESVRPSALPRPAATDTLTRGGEPTRRCFRPRCPKAGPMRLSLIGVAFMVMIPVSTVPAADDYKLGPDSQEQPGVPQGKVTQQAGTSRIFSGTVRDYWVYVPAQYEAKYPACVMVFQDGGMYVNAKGQFRVPIVFDNLIHKK